MREAREVTVATIERAGAGAAEPARAKRRHIPLAAKLASATVGLVATLLVVNAAVATWLAYSEARRNTLELQEEKAEAATARINGFISEIVNQIGWTTRAEWRSIPSEQQRYDFIRLLRQVPAITELHYVDGAGIQQLKVSRLEPDEVGPGPDLSADPRVMGAEASGEWFGPVTFRHGSEPYMAIAVRHAGRNPGVTIAEVNLKLIADVVTEIDVGGGGYAYVVGPAGRLVSHPDMSLVLRDTDMSTLPQVRAVFADGATSMLGRDLAGREVLTAAALIPRLGWAVFVESPAATALRSVYVMLTRAGLLLLVGLLAAVVLGTVLARRLTVPLRRLEAGAERLGAGDLSERIDVGTSDEFATLAERFNTMASSIQEAQETLEGKVRARTHDLDEALRFQKASADVLDVIGRSPDEVQPALDAIVETACTLCRADVAAIRVVDGDGLRLVAASLVRTGVAEHDLIPIGDASLAGRAILRGATVHVADLAADPSYTFVRTIGPNAMRTGFAVPLVDGKRVVGVIVLLRFAPEPFTAREVAIVESFADHAVIAMANGRLFAALSERTEALSRSLDELRAAQDRLVQTEKLASLGQLTAGIAHEIKNPLNFINNFSVLSADLFAELMERLAEAGLDDGALADVAELTDLIRANLDKIAAHGTRADSIVRNMLLHSRTGTGERGPVAVNALVDETLNLAWHGARASDPGFQVEIVRDLDPGAGTVEGFAQELSRVLLNLVSNAFDAVRDRAAAAGPDYRPTLTVTTRGTGPAVEIVVRDNGGGIAPDVRERMFEPFFTTKPAGKGTGLGLSLSHDIVVKQHGGTIEVTGDDGAEFRIRLPRSAKEGVV